MDGYIRRVDAFGRDVKLFLAYNLLADVGFGVFVVYFGRHPAIRGGLIPSALPWRSRANGPALVEPPVDPAPAPAIAD